MNEISSNPTLFELWDFNLSHLEVAGEESKKLPHLSTTLKTAVFALVIFPVVAVFEIVKNGLILTRNIAVLALNTAHSFFYHNSSSSNQHKPENQSNLRADDYELKDESQDQLPRTPVGLPFPYPATAIPPLRDCDEERKKSDQELSESKTPETPRTLNVDLQPGQGLGSSEDPGD